MSGTESDSVSGGRGDAPNKIGIISDIQRQKLILDQVCHDVNKFRPAQLEVLEAAERGDATGVLATGSGKTLIIEVSTVFS